LIHIIGGGLAGCEAAWQAASRGVEVAVHEMRPLTSTPVHKTDRLAELVCSNSFRSDKPDNAVGVLKQEMRLLGSLVMRAADETRVPAGAALAVDRARFSEAVTDAVHSHPLIHVAREEIAEIPEPADDRSPVVIATGPLTAAALSQAIAAFVGQAHLYFYDAISPIVLAETIDYDTVFRASRWGRSLRADDRVGGADPPYGAAGAAPPVSVSANPDLALSALSERQRVEVGEDGDYLNCPFTSEEYARFYDALVHAEKAEVHDFDRERFFEGCLPIEVMAHRGVDTLRFGPMKPVGLVDPRIGRHPYAVVQLRQDTLAGDHFSLVGFQTQLKWGEQARVFRLIPGLERAEFVRFGMIHRNTYINGPTVLHETWQSRRDRRVLFAGQISGVEGYVESAASGLLAGINAAAIARGEAPGAPPRTTAMGALSYYVSHANPADYQPSNITFGIMEPLDAVGRASRRRGDKMARKLAMAERACADLREWAAVHRIA
jgi:methylenetetrahydrofolate--tRNA-(uracil-5-)-methyltransferase